MTISSVKADNLLVAIEDVDIDNGIVNRRRYDDSEESPLLGLNADESEFGWPKISVPELLPW